ncbi:MAG: TetR family transcriptional regulator [Pseudomonadota bacterium]
MSRTAERIADAALRLFNRKGYASTTLAEIAADVGISQGNLTYHFRTKLDLALHLSERVRVVTEGRRAGKAPADLTDEYVGHLLFSMDLTWRYGFLMRDRGIFDDADAVGPPSPILLASFEDRRRLIGRIADAGLFRADPGVDLELLARSLWILSRHWIDHLREMEQCAEPDWPDMERGIRHHFAVLLPNLTAAGRRRFVAALGKVGVEI